MNVFQSPLLDEILSHLDDCKDLCRCSAVSKAWCEAASGVFPTSLQFSNPRGPPVPLGKITHFMKWLQARQQSGYFKHLLDLAVETSTPLSGNFTEACYQGDWISLLLHSVLMTTVCWQLTCVYLSGPINLYTTVLLLPATMQHLQLDPLVSTLSDIIFLSAFSRFQHLQSLTIIPQHDQDEGIDFCYTNKFVLDIAFPELNILTLGFWQFCKLVLADCVPKLQNMAVHVASVQASSLLALPSLQYAELLLEDIPKPEQGLDRPQLDLSASSQLTVLRLIGPPSTPIQVNIGNRPDLDFAQNGAGSKGTNFTCGKQTSYKPPIEFQS